MLLFRERQLLLRDLRSNVAEKVQAAAPPLPVTKKDQLIEEMMVRRAQEKEAQVWGGGGESFGKQEGQQILGLLKEFQGAPLRGPRSLVEEVERRNEELQKIQRRRNM